MAKQAAAGQKRGFKEFVRKFFVSLKRTPSTIALVVLFISFLFYSLNLADISMTTARVGRANMGQCEFVGMLIGILSLVVFLKCFPKRQKPNFIMVGLLVLMIALLVFVDIVYVNRIVECMNDPNIVFDYAGKDSYIVETKTVMIVHMIMMGVSAALLALLPVYSKLFAKINTSIEVEGNEDMAAIELTDDGE